LETVVVTEEPWLFRGLGEIEPTAESFPGLPTIILLNHLYKDDNYFAGRSMDVFITKLRKYLAVDPTVKILNIRGIGYKLIS
jgi:hypothetical protein